MQSNATALEPASLAIRLAACVYELLLVAAVVFIASLPAAPFARDFPSGWPHHLFQLYLLGMVFVYFAAFWLRSGQTLAMKTWRLRLVDDAGRRVDLKRAGVRFGLAVILPVSGMALASGLGGGVTEVAWSAAAGWACDWAWAVVDSQRRTLHDKLAGTLIVRVPRPA